jgi:hypothetical protein
LTCLLIVPLGYLSSVHSTYLSLYHRRFVIHPIPVFPCFACVPRFLKLFVSYYKTNHHHSSPPPAPPRLFVASAPEFCWIYLPSCSNPPAVLILTSVSSGYSVLFHRFILPPWRRFAAPRVTTSATRTPSQGLREQTRPATRVPWTLFGNRQARLKTGWIRSRIL